jgi:hypothetical protein
MNDDLCLSVQWMMGDGLLISPILNNGTDEVSAYFPEGEWYSLYTKALFQNGPGNWRKVTVSHPWSLYKLCSYGCCAQFYVCRRVERNSTPFGTPDPFLFSLNLRLNRWS